MIRAYSARRGSSLRGLVGVFMYNTTFRRQVSTCGQEYTSHPIQTETFRALSRHVFSCAKSTKEGVRFASYISFLCLAPRSRSVCTALHCTF
jgi:hypothetical protein